MDDRLESGTRFVPVGFVLQVSREGGERWVAPPPDASARWLDRALDTALGAHSPPPGPARDRVAAALVARLMVNGRPCRIAAPVSARLRVVGARATGHRRPARAEERRRRRAARLGAGSGAFSLCVLVAAMQGAVPGARAQEGVPEGEGGADAGPFYLGLGAGVSRLEPEPSTEAFELDEDTSTGIHLFAGYDLSRRLSLEAWYADLGEAGIDRADGGGAGEIDYTVYGIGALGRLGDATRPGLSGFLSAGVGAMDNDNGTDLDHEREHDVHLALGAGLEYGFGRGTSLRLEARAFDSDASYASLSIAKRFGRGAAADAPAGSATEDGAGEGAITADGAQAVDGAGATEGAAPTPDGALVAELDRALTVPFGFDGTALGTEARAEVDALAERVASGTGRVRLVGHADGTGPRAYNLALSVRRAEAVRDRLLERGVTPERIDVRGLGERRPVRSNATPEGRAANRRVEVLLG